jgi:hypothetical protein
MTTSFANPTAPLTEQARRLQQAMIGAAGPEATGYASTQDLPIVPASVRTDRGTVAVLGAGVAGLTIAYELRKRRSADAGRGDPGGGCVRS